MTSAQPLSLLLLPGLICDARLWRHQRAVLGEQAQVTIADISGADSIPALAAAVLSTAPARQFALAGLSMGGYVALEIMRQAPGRVLALALLDTSAKADSAEAVAMRRNAMRAAEADYPDVVEGLLPKLVHADHVEDALIAGTVRDMARDMGSAVFARQQTAILGRIDSRPLLPLIVCPTLVLCGRDDVITPPALHEEMAAAIHGAELEIVPRCGHLSCLDQPGAVSAAMSRWLKRIQRARAARPASTSPGAARWQ